jgi:hypothetical protein
LCRSALAIIDTIVPIIVLAPFAVDQAAFLCSERPDDRRQLGRPLALKTSINWPPSRLSTSLGRRVAESHLRYTIYRQTSQPGQRQRFEKLKVRSEELQEKSRVLMRQVKELDQKRATKLEKVQQRPNNLFPQLGKITIPPKDGS